MTRLIASWFGSGLILGRARGSDAGSGTVASLFAFPVAIWLGSFGILAQIGAAAAVTALAIWSVSNLVADEGDAAWIVIDEAAGTFIATISLGWGPGLVALVIFRVADIFKAGFPGVARADRVPGATGVVADDVIAAFYGLAAGLITKNLFF
ncbi:MAG: phosphatidylglycerophosphatase A [Acidimicrobiia bacterium]